MRQKPARNPRWKGEQITAFRTPYETRVALLRRAAQDGISVSELVRGWVTAKLAAE